MLEISAGPRQSPRLRSITAVLTSGCNLACSYCYQDAKTGRRMRWKTLQPAVDALLASERDAVELVFYGGEPLIRLDLIRRAVRYAECHRRPGQTVAYATITNGTLIDEAVADFLARTDFDVQLSFDGVAAVQALRGEGTFQVLDGLLDRLARDHRAWFKRQVSVSATVLPATVPHLAESVRYFLDKGVRAIGFSPGVTDTSSWRLEQIQELEEQFERIFELSLRRYRQTGQIPVECLRDPEGRRPLPQPHAMCNVERPEDLTLDVDGEVYGCAIFAESFQEFRGDFLRDRLTPLRLGALSHPALAARMAAYPEAVAAAEIFHRHDEKYSGYGECARCEFLDQCSVCPVSIGKIPGNRDPRRIPDFLCAFNLVSGRYRQRLAAEPGLWERIRAVTGR